VSTSLPASRRHPVRGVVRLGAVAAAVLALAACGAAGADTVTGGGADPGATSTAQPQGAQLVDGAEALALVEEGITLVDVRTPEEFAAGHVEGAVNVDLQSSTFLEQIGELPEDGGYVIYCASGNRSAQAAALMQGQGLGPVYDAGGIDRLGDAGALLATG
jgi:phage shock protein E